MVKFYSNLKIVSWELLIQFALLRNSSVRRGEGRGVEEFSESKNYIGLNQVKWKYDQTISWFSLFFLLLIKSTEAIADHLRRLHQNFIIFFNKKKKAR